MKLRMHIFACLLIGALTACGKSGETGQPTAQSDSSLTGTYGVIDASGKTTPFVKIEAGDSAGAYVLYEYHKGEWVRPKQPWGGNDSLEVVKPFEKTDLEKVVHHKVDVDVSGVQTRSFAFVHVPAGWSDGGAHAFATKGGYFAMTVLGPVDLVRM
jgi:hypothetical protein